MEEDYTEAGLLKVLLGIYFSRLSIVT